MAKRTVERAAFYKEGGIYSMHPEEREKLAPQVWNIIRERQASPDNMVDIATLSPLFAEAGLRHTDYGFATLRDFLREFREYLTMVDGISAGAGLPAKSYVQLKNFEKLENAEVQKADVPKDKELFAGPELSAAEKSDLEEKLREVFAAVVSDEAGWVNLAGLGAPLKENGVDAKQLGFQKIMPFLEQFPELLELKHEPSPSGKAWVAYARLRAAETALPAGRAGCAQATVAALGSDESSQAELSAEEKAELSPKVCSAVRAAISNEEGWVNLAGIGEALKGNGIDVKLLGFQKILPFLEQFPELLELKHEPTASGKAWVAYARLRENERREGDGKAEKAAAKPYAPRQGMSEYRTPESKFPSKDSWLFHWSRIPNLKIKELAEKALAEKWYYGTANAADAENYPILKNYLAYTFKRLVFEDKILYGDVADAAHAGEEYAAFNTGLVDQKYEYIYALFKKNTMSPQPYWYLLDFVVAGEQSGKTLARLFYPLPKRADYFENQFRNMVYDTSTQLLCDYTHIIVERIGRFPLRFLQENCPPNMLDIDGFKLEEVYPKHAKDSERKHYFEQLGERIRNTPMVLNNLKNRLEAAIHLTLKRVEWNYKTAIPVYFPTRNLCSLLLPLCLSEEGQVDLALVVEPLQSGAYQGQTVLPLDLAYNNSRLLTRPDSDWLRPDSIQSNGSDDEEE
nr:DUF3825 domain-containing protein [uncultured Stomatobaculum sp.]